MKNILTFIVGTVLGILVSSGVITPEISSQIQQFVDGLDVGQEIEVPIEETTQVFIQESEGFGDDIPDEGF